MADERTERPPYPFPLPSEYLDEEEDDKDGVSPYALASHFLRHARLLILLPVLAFILTAFYISTRDQLWVADSRFLPAKASELGSNTGGFVSQLNRLVGGSSGGSDGMFYRFLVPSSAFLRGAAGTEYEFTRTTESGQEETVRGTLAEIYGQNPATEATNVRASLGILKSMVTSELEPGTGFVRVSVRSEWPGLAVAVSDRLLEQVNQFNVEQRQSQAAAERGFVEQRLSEALAELREAESELVSFLERNQRYEQSPRLRYEAMRLESQAELKRALYGSLAQSFEQARINEVRNTPVVTVVERPEDTVYLPNAGNAPLRYGMMAFLIVAFLIMGLLAVRAYLQRQREENPDDFHEFRRLASESLPVPGRLRGRLMPPSGPSGSGPASGENGAGKKVPVDSGAASGSSDPW